MKSDLEKIITFYVTSRDRNRPAFVLDGRDYPDDATLRAESREAWDEMERRGVVGEWEYAPLRPNSPRSDIPTWREFRARLEAGEIDWLH